MSCLLVSHAVRLRRPVGLRLRQRSLKNQQSAYAYGWAVCAGDVAAAAVPEAGTLWLVTLGLVELGVGDGAARAVAWPEACGCFVEGQGLPVHARANRCLYPADSSDGGRIMSRSRSEIGQAGLVQGLHGIGV